MERKSEGERYSDRPPQVQQLGKFNKKYPIADNIKLYKVTKC